MSKRKVAIDARMIEASGIGTYIQHIIDSDLYDVAVGKADIIHKYNKDIEVIEFESSIYGLKGQLKFPERELKRRGIKMIHFPHYNVPLFYRGKFMVTVHDLTQLIFPEILGNKIKINYARMLMKHALTKSEHIFTVSNNSKEDICRIFKVDDDKVSITYNAVDNDFREKGEKEYLHILDKYEIEPNKKVILFVGNLKKHKNLHTLLVAFSKLPCINNYQLVLAGRSFGGEELKKRELELGIQDLVIHTGEVSKSELIDLYNAADLFVFPSIYEGFGIPPLEAIACGTPVIASNSSCIPEVLKTGALYFEPTNSEEIKDTIIRVVSDENLYANLIKEGKKVLNFYSWDSTRKVINDYLNL